ncbi:virulence associated secretory protein [Salmonella enterica subsp. enterica serovar Typhimurium]|nr:virulence associated secretory protein [Salmonella enterica subsp. enterica serovar Typhimurium]
MFYALYFEIHHLVASAALGFARVAPIFFFLPFLNSGVLSGAPRNAIIILVALGVWPHALNEAPPFLSVAMIPLVLQEAAVGVMLGCLLSWPFWVMHALGCIIDNQRGATLSSSIDPANGIDTSEMANFLNMFAAVVYLQNGGLVTMVDVLNKSYQLCDPMNECTPSLPPLLTFINQVAQNALVLASPVVLVLLLSEVFLGLLSRFAPQMNAFAISLTVKKRYCRFNYAALFLSGTTGQCTATLFPGHRVKQLVFTSEGRRMSSNKTEKPTKKRLEDSAKKGQSFKSKDLIIACLTLGGIAYLVSYGSFNEFMGIIKIIIADNFDQSMADYSLAVFGIGLKYLIPFMLLCLVCSALPALLQAGFVLATEALKPNLSALNPVEGAKKLFSMRTVKDTVKTLLYLSSFVVAAIICWKKYKVEIFSQLNGNIVGIAVIWRELLLALVLTCLACALIVLLLDAIAEYFLTMKDMKMDKEEVKREMKEQEGNPEVKSKRREVHMEILSEQVKSDIENSRLIVANPTHITIGIYFKPELMPIPMISVYETNQRALAVRAYAEKVGVPVIVDIKLARSLFKTHRRYDLVSLEEIDEVLRLLVWLEEVENAGKDVIQPQENEVRH